MIHLICGPIGAGKTTFAHKIAESHNAIRFSEDEWLSQLFVPDAPEGLLEQPMSVVGSWAGEKYQRCRTQIWQVCQQLLKANISIVVDGAAANKEQRDIVRQYALDNGVDFQLYFVSAEAHIRKLRVFARNENQGDTYSLEVTPDMFAYTERFFEAPMAEELSQIICIET